MNKVQRIKAVLKGDVPDAVPASFWFHFPEPQAHGKAMVKAHLDYYHRADLDFLKIMNEHRYHVETQIKTPSDWRKLKPVPVKSPFYQAMLDEIKMIVDELKGECLTVITIFNPFSSGKHASGYQIDEHLKADPDSVGAGMRTIAESLAKFSSACLDAGAGGIYFASQGGESDRFEDRIFTEIIKPTDLTVLNAIKDKSDFNIVHICQDKVRLQLYSDYPGNVVNWAATAPHNKSLVEGRDIFKRPILGGLDNRGVIVDGTPDEIRHAVHEVISTFGPRGFILGADCTLPTDIDIEKIRTAVEAARAYPLDNYPC
jgi:uroporphyrinogen decarboxylase